MAGLVGPTRATRANTVFPLQVGHCRPWATLAASPLRAQPTSRQRWPASTLRPAARAHWQLEVPVTADLWAWDSGPNWKP